MVARGGWCIALELGADRDTAPRPGARHGSTPDLMLDHASGSTRVAFNANSTGGIIYGRTCVGGNNTAGAVLATEGILGRDNSVSFPDEDEEGRSRTSDE
jgi:hypothetical protein